MFDGNAVTELSGRCNLKILVLSFYYTPDLSAGSFRTASFVNSLSNKIPPGYEIEVITTLPNRYSSFSHEALELERSGVCTIKRVRLPSHNSGMLDQVRAFSVFARKVMQLVKNEEYKLVYATSSRLMTAVLGRYIAYKKCSKLYLDIRDIFVDTINDVLPSKVIWLVKPFFSVLERWAVSSADKINMVSDGFREYFLTKYPRGKYSGFTNGIDSDFINSGAITDHSDKTGLPVVLYAGNIGEGQGLHNIIPELASRFKGHLVFRIIGDGGRKEQLKEKLLESGLDNVELLPPISRQKLLQEYCSADVLFLHLNDHEAFKKVLPSKIFEYAAVGKPIWAGVAGYSAGFIGREIDRAVVFSPCDVESAVSVFEVLDLKTSPRERFLKKYSRADIMEKMAEDVMSILTS